MIDRRSLVRLISGSIVTQPMMASAQSPRGSVIGFLSSRSRAGSAAVVATFRQGLEESGFAEGRDVTVDYRWAEGQYDRLPALAAELIERKVDVIFAAGGPPAALAAKAATTTIPIVFSAANDPVKLGLVATLARPGGNVTGMSTLTSGLGPKGIELLKEIVPAVSKIGYLLNQSNPSFELVLDEVRGAAGALGISVQPFKASTVPEIEEAFASAAAQGAGGMVVYGDPFLDSNSGLMVGLAARYRLPACYAWRDFAVAGGLMSYGTSIVDSYRGAALYVGKILKGEKPADLPVQEPTKFELVVNLKTARAFGFTIPPSIMVRADEVIE